MYSESRDWDWSCTEPEVITGPEIRTELVPVFVYNVSGGDTMLHCVFRGSPPGEGTHIYYMRKHLPTGLEDGKEYRFIPCRITLQAYPNPFNSSTIISLNNPEGGNAEIEIFNLFGQRIKSFIIEGGKEGKIIWDARDALGNKISSGVYFARARTSQNSTTVKLLYLK